MPEEIEITVAQKHNGLLLSTIYKDQYYKFLYGGYTVDEAREAFVEYVNDEDGKIFRNQD